MNCCSAVGPSAAMSMTTGFGASTTGFGASTTGFGGGGGGSTTVVVSRFAFHTNAAITRAITTTAPIPYFRSNLLSLFSSESGSWGVVLSSAIAMASLSLCVLLFRGADCAKGGGHP